MKSTNVRLAVRVFAVALLCSFTAGVAFANESIEGSWRGKVKIKGDKSPRGKAVMDLAMFQSGQTVFFSGNVYFDFDSNGVPIGEPDEFAFGSFVMDERQLQGTITREDEDVDDSEVRGYEGKVNKNASKMKWKTVDADGKVKYKLKRLGEN